MLSEWESIRVCVALGDSFRKRPSPHSCYQEVLHFPGRWDVVLQLFHAPAKMIHRGLCIWQCCIRAQARARLGPFGSQIGRREGRTYTSGVCRTFRPVTLYAYVGQPAHVDTGVKGI